MWTKIITIKRTKDLNYFSLCALYLFNTQFYNLSWITEINELFHDILIYWDAPVYIYIYIKYININIYITFIYNKKKKKKKLYIYIYIYTIIIIFFF